mgnify:CR=1 FL=1
MSKKVLILSGSPRKNGNSDLLCDEFMRGATESGNDVEKIRVASKNIAPCSGCYYCSAHNGECVHKDDMATMADKELSSVETTLACFRGYADCVEGAVEKGVIIGNGVHDIGEIKNTAIMNQAYTTGKNI